FMLKANFSSKFYETFRQDVLGFNLRKEKHVWKPGLEDIVSHARKTCPYPDACARLAVELACARLHPLCETTAIEDLQYPWLKVAGPRQSRAATLFKNEDLYPGLSELATHEQSARPRADNDHICHKFSHGSCSPQCRFSASGALPVQDQAVLPPSCSSPPRM